MWLRARRGSLGVVALVAFVIVVGFASLYAYRAQVPATPRIPYTQALSEIQNGQVRSVTVEGERAVLVLHDGRTQETTVPDRDEMLARAVTERDRADPAGEAPDPGLADALRLLSVWMVSVWIVAKEDRLALCCRLAIDHVEPAVSPVREKPAVCERERAHVEVDADVHVLVPIVDPEP